MSKKTNNKTCKYCGKPLSSNSKNNYCASCAGRHVSAAKVVGGVVLGVAAVVVVAAKTISKIKK